MYSLCSALTAIRHLNGQKRFLWEFKTVLLASETDAVGLCHGIQDYMRRVFMQSSPSSAVAEYFDKLKLRKDPMKGLPLEHVLNSVPSCALSDSADELQFIVLDSPNKDGFSRKKSTSKAITNLPISLHSLSQYIQRTAPCMHSRKSITGSEKVNLLRLESGAGGISTSFSEYVKLFLRPRSVDLMILDFPHRTLATFVHDSLVLSSFLLSSSGSLLLVHSTDEESMNPSSTAVLRRLAKRKFREVYWPHRSSTAATGYLYGTAIADGEIGRVVDRDDFPGFLPKGKKRVRRWNPYERQKFNYVQFLGPSFTAARYTKEALQNLLDQQQNESEALIKQNEELFAVSYEMVARESFYSNRDN